MKEKRIFTIMLFISIALIVVGLRTQIDYYSIFIMALGFGIGIGALVQLVRISHYQKSGLQMEYEKREKKSQINFVAERDQFLKAKSNHIAHQIMSICLLILVFVLALFRVSPWMIGTIFLLFILNGLISVIAYHYFKKRL